METADGSHGCTLPIYLMPLNGTLIRVKKVNFMLYVLFYNKKKNREEELRSREMFPQSDVGLQTQWNPRYWEQSKLFAFIKSICFLWKHIWSLRATNLVFNELHVNSPECSDPLKQPLGVPKLVHYSLCHTEWLFVWLSTRGACEHEAGPCFLSSTWYSRNEWKNKQMSDHQEGDAPAVLSRMREIVVWVLPMVLSICFFPVFAACPWHLPIAGSLPRLCPATTWKVWAYRITHLHYLPLTWRRR